MEHFVIKSLSIFFLYLYVFGFILLVKWENTRGQGEAMEVPHLIAEEKKIGDKDKTLEF